MSIVVVEVAMLTGQTEDGVKVVDVLKGRETTVLLVVTTVPAAAVPL